MDSAFPKADSRKGTGSFEGVELTGTLPSFFAGLKTETLIYQCFYFAKTAKNAIFGSLSLRSGYNSDKLHFNAWLFCKTLIINNNNLSVTEYHLNYHNIFTP